MELLILCGLILLIGIGVNWAMTPLQDIVDLEKRKQTKYPWNDDPKLPENPADV